MAKWLLLVVVLTIALAPAAVLSIIPSVSAYEGVDILSVDQIGVAYSPDFGETASTGTYIWPTYGNLSSKFGPRRANVGSRNHKGIDITGTVGRSIFAADGGEVIFSGRNGAFGNMVQILHDNGHMTIYAHCSETLVSVGERVSQGQKVALKGRTGVASGVHLHFELIINGVNVDPLLHLPYNGQSTINP